MEVGVRLVGILLRLISLLLLPYYWLKDRKRQTVPPLKNPILLKSATELAADIKKSLITSEQLVSFYIERIQEVNPLINALVEERFRAALEDAKAVDRLILEAKRNGTVEELYKEKLLLGVPFTVKESCSLAGLSNSVGCLENAGRRAAADGAVVALIKKAGAIPLLVSNTPELCLGWETTNLIRGTTNNPYRLNRTAGGSSGGEAALLACGASPFSVSSDIAGSIRLPAAFCGVFGHKPTPGVIPIDGHLPTLSDPLFPRFLTVGPMCRRAEDLPLLTTLMAGDNAHKLRLDEPVDFKKLKVHYMTEATKSLALIGVESCISDAIIRSVRSLVTDCGAQFDMRTFPELEDSVEISISVFFSMKDIPNMLQDPTNPKVDRSLPAELLKAALGGGARSLQALSFAAIEKTRLFIPDSRNGHYASKAGKLKKELTEVLGDAAVLLYPVHCGRAHAHHGVFTRASGVMYTMMFNVLGVPAASVPAGLHDGLPVAIQVIAAPNQDRLCLAVAAKLEKVFGGWTPAGGLLAT